MSSALKLLRETDQKSIQELSTMLEETHLQEEVKKSIRSEDEPLGEQVPGAPFALVALSYIGVLAVAILGTMVAMFLWG